YASNRLNKQGRQKALGRFDFWILSKPKNRRISIVPHELADFPNGSDCIPKTAYPQGHLFTLARGKTAFSMLTPCPSAPPSVHLVVNFWRSRTTSFSRIRQLRSPRQPLCTL